MSLIEVSFPGGKKLETNIKGFTVDTDQPVNSGGGGSAPTPFDLFLSSIAACTGVTALSFCQSRNIDTKGLKLSLDTERDEETGMISDIKMELTLPENFPSKYEEAIRKATDSCTVKKHIINSPDFKVILK
ncbi:putative peroxiredoxin, OsmC-like protein [Gottschalkia purinilytica]|uniref:Putative peroxiredoxin, OsmC-like protein n=1 Tax=Gottschalkia purinilytica TaxID=1503 RepID=A0A0L0WA69_GOTPU|nr:OsmC family protein [Gottschalkia purinilytica]KNF08366.1 putative peroxiredoxin, OsmC-like protein [Gottschalkia purinilytica]